jgi:hypothetical protein
MFGAPDATLQAAAQHIGWTTRKLRFYLTQPHVLRWMLEEKQAHLEAASAGNVGRYWRCVVMATTRWRLAAFRSGVTQASGRAEFKAFP